MNEKALIKRCQRGDRQAFDELIRLYYDYVSGFLRKATENETLCKDLTQETFLKMIRSIERFDPGGSASFGTWLITIARNCYIDQLRRNRIRLEDIDVGPFLENATAHDIHFCRGFAKISTCAVGCRAKIPCLPTQKISSSRCCGRKTIADFLLIVPGLLSQKYFSKNSNKSVVNSV